MPAFSKETKIRLLQTKYERESSIPIVNITMKALKYVVIPAQTYGVSLVR